MIIQYEMKYTFQSDREWVEMCGEFLDMNHFKRFVNIEQSYRRMVQKVKVLKD